MDRHKSASATLDPNCTCLSTHGCCTLQRNALPDKTKQQRFCLTDDYDFCPIYLSYLLTHTQSLRCDSDWLDAQH